MRRGAVIHWRDGTVRPALPVVAAGDFDEDLHPRDDHGRFGRKGDRDEQVLGVGAIRPTLDPGRLPHHPTADDIEESAVNWQYYNACANARYAAECMLGQDHPTVPDFASIANTTGDYAVLQALEAGHFVGSDDDKTQMAVDDAHNLLVGVRDAAWSDLPLFRGVPLDDEQPGTDDLRALKPGDTFDLSLASFSNDRDTAEQFSNNGPPAPNYRDPGPWPAGTSRMIFTLEDGAKGAASDTTAVEVHVGGTVVESGPNIGNYEGGSWEQGHNDVVVGGRLEVIDVRPYVGEDVHRTPSKTTVEVVVRQVGVFDPDHGGELISVKEHAMAAAGGHRTDRYTRAPFWQAFGPSADALAAAGDWNEALHPRDEHGRFGDSGGGDLAPASPDADGRALLRTRLDGSEVEHSGAQGLQMDDIVNEKGEAERGRAKEELVAAIADRMSTTDHLEMVSVVLPGLPVGWLLRGEAAEDARRALVAEAQARSNPSDQEKSDWGELAGSGTAVTTADVLERLQADPDMLVKVERSEEDGISMHWLNPTSDPPLGKDDRDNLTERGWVKADSPEVDAAIRQEVVNQMVKEWAGTSNDASKWALTLQDNAAEVFGLKGTKDWDTSLLRSSLTDEYRASVTPIQQDFLKAVYATTQDYLKANGVESITLSRGFKFYDETMVPEWAKHEGPTEVPLRPISSWSGDPDMAVQFGGGDENVRTGAVITAEVPAERILSTSRSGIGALSESEFVVLGGTNRVNVTMAALTDEAAPFDEHPPKLVGSGGADRERDQATRNEDWIKTLGWDLPADPARFAPGELERLAALPAGEQMPVELRRIAIGLTAAGDFDESKHPRDARGRFGDKGGGDVGDGAPRGWKATTVTEVEAQAFDELVAGGLNEDIARESARQVAQEWTDKGTVAWVSQDGQRMVMFDAPVDQADRVALVRSLDDLATSNPPAGPVSVTVVPTAPSHNRDALGDGTYGMVTGRSNIRLNVNIFDADTQRTIRGTDHVTGRSAMDQAAADPKVAVPDYVLTHEYGHVLEASKEWHGTLAEEYQHPPDRSRDNERFDALKELRPVSVYGMNNSRESYAEAFAHYRLNPEPAELPDRLAAIDGWTR